MFQLKFILSLSLFLAFSTNVMAQSTPPPRSESKILESHKILVVEDKGLTPVQGLYNPELKFQDANQEATAPAEDSGQMTE